MWKSSAEKVFKAMRPGKVTQGVSVEREASMGCTLGPSSIQTQEHEKQLVKEQAADVGGRKPESGDQEAKGRKCFQGEGQDKRTRQGQDDAVDRSGKVRTELRSETPISKARVLVTLLVES